MASGGINVGSASVTIVPDLRGFSGQVAAGVTPQAAALGQALGKVIGDRIASQINDGINRGLGTNPRVRQQGTKQGDDFAGSFSDAFRAKLEAAFKSLPKINLDANSTQTDIVLASIREQLDELSQKQINIDISEAEAIEKIGILKARLEELRTVPSLQVQADTARATAQLDDFLAYVKAIGAQKAEIKVDVDAGAAEAELAALDAEAGAAAGGFSGLIAAGIALAPALIPVIAAVTAAVIALLSVLGAGIIGVGVLALGFLGVVKGVQALNQENNKAAGSGRSAAQSAISQAGALQQLQQAESSLANTRANAASAATRAAEAVKNAKAAEVDAETNAAQQIDAALKQVTQARDAATAAEHTAVQNNQAANQQLAQSEQGVIDAQKQATDAQTALTEARKTAQQQAQDLANQVTDGALAQRQAVIDVAAAQDQLNQANASPISSQAQKDQAQLAFDQALQHQKELGEQQQQLVDKKAESDKDGIEGSAGVVAAQQAVVQANQNVVDAQDKVTASFANMLAVQQAGSEAVAAAQQAIKDATLGVQQAQTAGAKSVAKAEQAVTDAIRSQSDQQRQSAFSIQQALAAVAAAHRGISSAALGGGGSVAATNAAADAFAKLDPATQQFAHFVHDQLIPAFKGIQGAAAAGLLPGVEAGLKLLLPLFKSLKPFVGDVAKALGDLFLQGSKALTDPFWTQFILFVETNAIPVIQGLAGFIGDIVTGLAGLVEGFAPTTATVGGAIAAMGQSFADFGTSAGLGTNSGFNSFLAYLQQALPVVGGFIEDLVGVVSDVVQVFAPWGLLLLGLIDDVAKLIIAIGPKGLAFMLLAVGAAIVAIAGPAGPISLLILGFTLIAGGADYLYTHVKSVHDFVDQHILPIFHQLADYFTSTVLPILKRVGGEAMDGIRTGLAEVGQAIDDHKPQLDDLVHKFEAIVDFVVKRLVPVLGPILKQAFIAIGDNIAAFILVISTIDDAFNAIPGAAVAVWNTIADVFTTGVNGVIDGINFFINALRKIPGVGDLISPIGHIGSATHQSPPPDGTGHGGSGGGRSFATGGVLPGYSPGIDSIYAVLSPGEGVLVPEAVRLLGASFVYDINKFASGGRANPQRFGIGGIAGAIGGGLKSIGGGAIGVVEGIGGAVVNKAIGLAEHEAHNVIHSLIDPGIFRGMADGAIDTIGNALKFSGGGVVGGSADMAAFLGAGQAARYQGNVVTGATVIGSQHENHFHNQGRSFTPNDFVQAQNQLHALHGTPQLVGVT